jgi:ATP-binding cassette, subfamily B, multidrug efflux pump
MLSSPGPIGPPSMKIKGDEATIKQAAKSGSLSSRHYLWEMRSYFRQVAGELTLGSLAGIIMNTAVVLPPILMGRAIDRVLAFSRGEASGADVTWAVLVYVGGTLATEGPRVLKRWWLMTANARIRANVRADALRGVFAWPMEKLHSTPVGDLMARIVGDVEVLGVGVREFTIETWDTVLFSLSLVVAMLLYDPILTLLALSAVPVAMLLAQASGRWVTQRTTASRQANASLTAFLQEHIAGVRVLRLFGRAGAAVTRVSGLARKQADTNLDVVRLKAGLQPVYTTLVTAGVLFVIWQGGIRTVAGAMTVGTLIAYLQLYLRFVERGFRIPQLVNSIQSGSAAYKRLKPLMAPALSVKGEPRRASFKPGHVAGIAQLPNVPAASSKGPAAVFFENVTFRYPGALEPALQGITLNIPRGSVVAVTGPVGCGKSALARAMLGLYPLETGRVLLDNRPLEDFPPGEVAARIGYLPQDAYLFSGSVRENIQFGISVDLGHASATSEIASACASVDKAVAIANLTDDVASFGAGLETEIGELGVRVSGGQRQRIALARAMAAAAPNAPALLILDDPFSAVDVDTEAHIVSGLKSAFGPDSPPEQQATVVLCSHRLAAFPQADMVVVLDDGRIVEQGTHSALLEEGGLYARIFYAQSRIEAG